VGLLLIFSFRGLLLLIAFGMGPGQCTRLPALPKMKNRNKRDDLQIAVPGVRFLAKDYNNLAYFGV
jgi:hypothetical protein